MFGKLHQLGADRIYAINANRKYLTGKKIFTCFPKKGPKTEKPEEKTLRSIIANQRATVMEGSFGTHKTAYGLGKIKAKKQNNEILWVFFGVMTANAVKLSKRAASESPPPGGGCLIYVKNIQILPTLPTKVSTKLYFSRP